MADIDETNEAAEKLGANVKDIGVLLNDIVDSLDNIATHLEQMSGGAKGFMGVLDNAVKTMDGLPKGLRHGRDLWKAMRSDAELFKKVQLQINDSVEKSYIDSLQEGVDLLTEQNASTEEFNKFFDDLSNKQKSFTEELENQFTWGEKNMLTQKKIDKTATDYLAKLENINALMKKWGHLIRNPRELLDNILTKLGDMPKKIKASIDKHGSLGKAIKAGAGEGLGKVKELGKQLFTKGGMLVAGVGLAVAAVTGLFMLFRNYWDFIDKKVLPAQADFNKQIGGSSEATGKLQGQMDAMADRFDRLGMTFDEGAGAVRNVAEGLKTVELDPKTLKTGTELAAILGLNADEIGAMALQFQKATGSIEGVNEMMVAGAQEATAYGLPVNAVLKDMARAPNVLARFGTANAKEFAKATAKAQSYGLSIQDVNGAFGEQMDSFDNTAEAAAKLNTIFGTNINSMELMLETNPVKRMEMLRGELEKQGKSWDKLNEFEKNVITQNLGVDKSQAALILSSEEERKKLEKKAASREREMKINERWNKGISSLRRTLINWGSELDHTMRSITELISTMFGWDKPAKNIHETAGGLLQAFRDLNKWLDETKKNWGDTSKLDGWGKSLKWVAEIAKLFWNGLKFGVGLFTGMLQAVGSAIGKITNLGLEWLGLKDTVDGFFGAIGDFDWDMVLNWITNLNENMSAIDFSTITEFFKVHFGKALNAAGRVLKMIVDGWKLIFKGFADFVGNMLESPLETIKGTFNDVGSWLSSLVGDAADFFGGKKSVGDAIITKTGQVIETHPEDNLIATKASPTAVMSTASGLSEGAVANDIKAMKDAIMKMASGGDRVEIVDINMDGRKVGEATVRISRF